MRFSADLHEVEGSLSESVSIIDQIMAKLKMCRDHDLDAFI